MDKTIPNRKYRWTAHSSDKSWSDRSQGAFDTQEECYMDMMNHAVDKMKWNIEWDDIVYDSSGKCELIDGIMTYDTSIYYGLTVTSDTIIHTSYSGTYIYSIETVPAEWKPRYKVNDIIRNGTTVAIIACANEKTKDPEDFGYRITICGHEAPRYDKWTKDAEHWIPCKDEGKWCKIGEVTLDVENGEL